MKKQIIILLLIISLTVIMAENPLLIKIQENQTNFTVNEYFPPIFASQLIKENPNIQSISVSEYGQTFGYLNTFGGIGTNFLIEPDKNYEIHTNQTIIIRLKY